MKPTRSRSRNLLRPGDELVGDFTAEVPWALGAKLTGSFGSATTLGGIPLGADTAFSLTAIFDGHPSANVGTASGYALFPITSLLIVLGDQTYIEIPGASLNLIFFSELGRHVIGLADGKELTRCYFQIYHDAKPDFLPSAPAPVEFSGNAFDCQREYPIQLLGVPGGLVIHQVGSALSTASITECHRYLSLEDWKLRETGPGGPRRIPESGRQSIRLDDSRTRFRL